MQRFLLALVVLGLAIPALASPHSDMPPPHGQFHLDSNREFVIPAGMTAGDIACVFCHVIVHGDVNGDIAVAFGRVSIDDGRTVSGDVAAFGSDLYMGRGSRINGDLALVAGDPTISDDAEIHGSRAILPGHAWLLVLLLPFLLLGGIIWLIVYFVRRNRYQFPVYPPPVRRP